MNRLENLGRAVREAQERSLQDSDKCLEVRSRLLSEPMPRTLPKRARIVSLCVAIAGGLAILMLALIPYHYRFGFMRTSVEAAVDITRLILLTIVLFAVASLFIERNPVGGFRLTRSLTLAHEFLLFVRERKLWWMTPIMLILTLLSTFIVVTEKSVVLPFIYAVF